MIKRNAGCNMVISGWVWSTVEDFHFSRKELTATVIVSVRVVVRISVIVRIRIKVRVWVQIKL